MEGRSTVMESYPFPMDDFPAEPHHHMEEVIDDLSRRALRPDLDSEGGVHVHGHGMDRLPGFLSGGLKEGADDLLASASASSDSVDLVGLRVRDDRGLAMALMECKHVHDQLAYARHF